MLICASRYPHLNNDRKKSVLLLQSAVYWEWQATKMEGSKQYNTFDEQAGGEC